MIEGLISGKVYGRPEQRVGSNSGKPFVMAKTRAATATAGGGGEMLYLHEVQFVNPITCRCRSNTDGCSAL